MESWRGLQFEGTPNGIYFDWSSSTVSSVVILDWRLDANYALLATNYHATRHNSRQIRRKVVHTFTGFLKSRSGHNCTKKRRIFSKAVRRVVNPYYCYLIIGVTTISRNQHHDW